MNQTELTAYLGYLLWVRTTKRNTSTDEIFPALKIRPKQNNFLDKLHVLALTQLLITIKTT